ncbi:MAG: hypothetical protein KKD94_01320, partial [Nanoarchaeota archaeon]|nr:hypothetical protein [Nanoarchaeota archaeon]
GNEKRFFEFISKLNDKDKIALITHTDLDGVGAAKIVNEVVKTDFLRFIDYAEINDSLLKELKQNKINKLIITDISITEPGFVKKAEKFADILMIDHHLFQEDFNTEKTIFLNPGSEYCATYICYYLFSKAQDLEKYDWLVACASLSDYMTEKNKPLMESVYKKYGDPSPVDPTSTEHTLFNDLKNDLDSAIVYWKTKGNLKKVLDEIGEKFADIGTLRENAKEVENEIKTTIEKFKEEKEEINGRYFWLFEPKFRIGSKLNNLISKLKPNKTHILVRPHGDKYVLSARRQDKEENMVELLKKLLSGLGGANSGGHIPAAGGHFLKKDLEKVKERLKSL